MPLPDARTLTDSSFHNTIIWGDHARHNICIIGGGAAGSQFYKESVQRLVDTNIADVVSYTMIDSRAYEFLGQGVAWNAGQSDLLLANMRIQTIGFSQDVISKLSAVVSMDEATSLTDKELFRRRSEIGKILHEDFHEKVLSSRSKGMPFTHVQASCTAIYRLGSGYVVETDTGLRYFVHDVILALGNSIPSTYVEHRESKNFQANPWDWEAYGKIKKEAHVGVIGLGPTAIDSILLLNQQGIKKITSFSRDGQIQAVRPRSSTYNPKYMTSDYITDLFKEYGLSFQQVILIIHTEFKHAGVPCSEMRECLHQAKKLSPLSLLMEGLKPENCEVESKWFAVLKSFDDVTPLIWSLLPDAERSIYMKQWRSAHTAVSYGMASIQARRVSGLLHDRHLSIISGMTGLRAEGEHFVFECTDKSGKMLETNVDYVINCSGIGTDITKSENELVRFLVEHKYLIPHPRGGACVDFESGQILNENGVPEGSVYSLVGSLTYGTHLLTHCFGEVTKSAIRTAQAIHRSLSFRYQSYARE